ncbi:hypothetical protein HDU76_005326, partial [Blyttiomyces sp. JEL0837]
WRQVLEKNDPIQHMSVDSQSVITVSGTYETHIRSWDAGSGFILWDYKLHNIQDPSKIAAGGADVVSVSVPGSAIPDLIVLSAGHVTRLSGKLGSKVWQKKIEKGLNTKYHRLAVSGDLVCAAGVKKTGGVDSGVLLHCLNLKDGTTTSETPESTWNYFPRKFANKGSEYFFVKAAEKGDSAFLVWNAAGASAPVMVQKLGDSTAYPIDVKSILQTTGSELLAVQMTPGSSEFVVKSETESAVMRIVNSSSGPKATVAHRFQASKANEVSVFTSTVGDKSNLVVARIRLNPTSKHAVADLVDLDSNAAVGSFNVPYNLEKSGLIQQIQLDTIQKTGTVAFRLFYVSESGDMAMIKENENIWVRDESIANVAGAVFVDLPESQLFSLDHDELNEPLKQTDRSNPVARFIKRLTVHAEHLQEALTDLPTTLSNRVNATLSKFTGSGAQAKNATSEITLFRDTFGFRKILLIASKNGRVHALETEKGRLVWSRWIKNLSIKDVHVVRETVVKYPPVIALIGEQGTSNIIWHLNALDGEDFKSQAISTFSLIDGTQNQVIQLPIEDPEEHLQILVTVDADLKIHVLPNSKAAKDVFLAFSEKFYFYDGKIGEKNVTGYIAAQDSNGEFRAVKTWNVEFPEGEVIAAAAERRGEASPSLGRVLGNRSVIYKYLNPNLLAVATVKETSDSSTVYLYLIDTITGSIYHRSEYLGAGHAGKGVSSIHLIQVDNAIFMTYFNKGPNYVDLPLDVEDIAPVDAEGGKKKRGKKPKKKAVTPPPEVKGFEIVALEVIEDLKPDHRDESPIYSSFTTKRPQVIAKTFMFPFAVTAVGSTITNAGIATRELLVSIVTNEIMAINRRMLDPRRPIGQPTSDDKEEMLIPYQPVIPYMPREVVSYNLTVAGVEGIISSPSEIESTSLVIAYGLDLFFVRRAPSKTFDVLSEDFNYLSLIATMVLLVVGIEVSKYFAQRKRLMDAWK